jgi:uncharacterized protein
MQFQQFGDRYIVRLHSGEPVMETLTAFLRERGVGFASVSAIGAVRRAELGYWNADTQEYEFRAFEEQLEVVSFGGNCSIRDGEPFLHIHCALGRQDFSLIGGHLKEALVHPTLEVWLQTEPERVRRARDQGSGLYLLQLPDA